MPEEKNERAEGQKRPEGRGKLIALGAGVVVVSALVAFLVVRLAAGSSEKPAREGVLFEVGEFTTNLAPGSPKSFVKVKVVLELDSEKTEEEVKERLPIIQDKILLFLNSKTSNELAAENRGSLKKELLAELNKCLARGEISNIYFSDLVMQ